MKTLDDLIEFLQRMNGDAYGNFLAQLYNDPENMCFWYNEGIQNMCNDTIEIAKTCKDIDEFRDRFPNEYSYNTNNPEYYVDGVNNALNNMWEWLEDKA